MICLHGCRGQIMHAIQQHGEVSVTKTYSEVPSISAGLRSRHFLMAVITNYK